MTPIVRLVDDDAALRDGLRFALRMAGIEAVGYESAEAFLKQDDPMRPGCVVLDIRMDGMSGLECQQRMKAAGFLQPVIFLSGHGDIEMALQAIKNGAADFLTKPVQAEKLAQACRRLFAWDKEARSARAIRDEARKRFARLTPRERDVASLALKGLPNKAIAAALGISEQAVKIHRSNLYGKLELHSAVEIRDLVAKADLALDEESNEANISRTDQIDVKLLPSDKS